MTYSKAKELIESGADELAIAAKYWRGIARTLEKIHSELSENEPLLCMKYEECSECPFGRVNRRCLKSRSPRNWVKRALEKTMGVAEEMATAFDSIQNSP